METSLKGYLVEHPFLASLRDDYLELLVGCASNVRFDAGEYLFKEGQEADRFFMLRRGKVSVEIYRPNTGALTIQTLGEGEVLGWSWLVPPFHWQFDARATELIRAVALDGACLREKCEKDYYLGYEIMKRFSHIIMQRLQATRIQLLDLYGEETKR